ncbi:hypothetical protein H0H92_013082 [Tricholoma furcatifolium]|nr:hypothetical protein H0H92_013082 [Tricholoma furcatifolium]
MYNGQKRREPGRGNSNEEPAPHDAWSLWKNPSILAQPQQNAETHATSSRPTEMYPPPGFYPDQEYQSREQAYNTTSNSQIPSQVPMHPSKPPSQSLHPVGRFAQSTEPYLAGASHQPYQYSSFNSVPGGVIPGSAAGPPTTLPSSRSLNPPTIDTLVKQRSARTLEPLGDLLQKCWATAFTCVQAEMGRMHTELVGAHARENGARIRFEQEAEASKQINEGLKKEVEASKKTIEELKEINEELKKVVEDHVGTKVKMGVIPQINSELERLRAQNKTLMEELEHERVLMRDGSRTGAGSTSTDREMSRNESQESENIKSYIDQHMKAFYNEQLERQKEFERELGKEMDFSAPTSEMRSRSIRTMWMSPSPLLDQGMHTSQTTNASPRDESQTHKHAREPDSSASNKISSKSLKIASQSQSQSKTYMPLSSETTSSTKTMGMSPSPSLDQGMPTLQTMNASPLDVSQTPTSRPDSSSPHKISSESPKLSSQSQSNTYVPSSSPTASIRPQPIFSEGGDDSLILQVRRRFTHHPTHLRLQSMELDNNVKAIGVEGERNLDMDVNVEHRATASPLQSSELRRGSAHGVEVLQSLTSSNSQRVAISRSDSNNRPPATPILADSKTFTRSPSPITAERSAAPQRMQAGSRAPGAGLRSLTLKESQLGWEGIEEKDEAKMDEVELRERNMDEENELIPPIAVKMEDENISTVVVAGSRSRLDHSQPDTHAQNQPLPGSPALPIPIAKPLPNPLQPFYAPASVGTSSPKRRQPQQSAQLPPQSLKSGPLSPPVRSSPALVSVVSSAPSALLPHQARHPPSIVSPSLPEVLTLTTVPPYPQPLKNAFNEHPHQSPSASVASAPVPPMRSLKRDRSQYEDDKSAERMRAEVHEKKNQ